MKVGVVGLGFVGLSLSVVLAYKGYEVIGIDINEEKVRTIKNGRAPFYEENLEELLSKVINSRLVVSTDYGLLRNTNLVFICVDTPTNPDGSQNQSHIINAIKGLAKTWRNASEYKVMIVKSTVVPGTTRKLAYILSKESGLNLGTELGVAVNPEFLREGKAIHDILYPSRVIIGCIDEKTCNTVTSFWKEFYKRVGINPPILSMSLDEAELTKYASNAFLAMKVSFANTIANICEKIPNCDVIKVLQAVGLDPRIGKEYLRPGLGYGGPCLPKDLKALIYFSRKVDYKPILLEAVDEVNEKQPIKAIEYLIKEYGSLKGKTIGILGLAFKPGTDDLRNAVSIKIIKELIKLYAKVKVHDPKALEQAKRILGDSVIYCKDPLETIKDCDGVIIVTEWDIYKSIKPEDFKKLMKRPIVIDGRRLYDPQKFINNGIKIYAIGYGAIKSP